MGSTPVLPRKIRQNQQKTNLFYAAILDQTQKFEVICTSDLEMVTWKPISIEAVKVIITSLNQLRAVLMFVFLVFVFS